MTEPTRVYLVVQSDYDFHEVGGVFFEEAPAREIVAKLDAGEQARYEHSTGCPWPQQTSTSWSVESYDVGIEDWLQTEIDKAKSYLTGG